MASGQKIVEITTMLLLLSKVAKNSEAAAATTIFIHAWFLTGVVTRKLRHLVNKVVSFSKNVLAPMASGCRIERHITREPIPFRNSTETFLFAHREWMVNLELKQ